MIKILLVIFFICAFPFAKGYAQINLVRNPSFEQYSKCPLDVNLIKSAYYWQPIDSVCPDTPILAALCTPEYCNACDTLNYSEVCVPRGFWYNHYPRTGKGMVMIETYFDNSYAESYQRDYLQGHFYRPLTAGVSYCVTFYVILEQLSQYANNHIGAYIDDGSIDIGQDSAGCASPQNSFVPQIVEDSIINDTLNWVKIQGTFTANGTERFITIGNFFDITHTDTIRRNLDYPPWNFGNEFAWYLVDDVSVIAMNAVANAGIDRTTSATGDSVWVGDSTGYLPCYWYKNGILIDSNTAGFKVKPDSTSTYVMQLDVCGHITSDTVIVHVAPAGIAIPATFDNLNIYPNPAKNSVSIEGVRNCNVAIYDIIGTEIISTFIYNGKQNLDVGKLSNGVYSIIISDTETGQKICRRLIKE